MERHIFPIPLSVLSMVEPVSAVAIRHASSPKEALILFKSRLRYRSSPTTTVDPHDSHAAVFTLKHCSSCPVVTNSGRLIPSLHAHILKASLLSCAHVSCALLHCYSISSIPFARVLFDEIPNKNVVTYNTMVTCYARHGNVAAAREVFDQMPERDIASWSAIICGYMHNRGSNPSQAFFLFREMIHAGKSKPDPMILVTVLSGCAESGSLGLIGKSVHAYIERNHMDINVQLGTSLIAMYGRSGCLKSAFNVFERMPERNVMHWTAMICGLATHGYSKEALVFFERMIGAGINIKPNKITFTGVLNACRHAGMVEEGHKYFCSMKNDFGLDPEIYHYGCMVDLLANSGMLDDAYSMIQGMKVEPNVVIWTSILAGCKKYKNFGIAEKVIEKVLQVAEPDDDGGVYSLVSDMYALGGRWNDVQKLRVLMDRLIVKKRRGSSFIEVNDIQSSSF